MQTAVVKHDRPSPSDHHGAHHPPSDQAQAARRVPGLDPQPEPCHSRRTVRYSRFAFSSPPAPPFAACVRPLSTSSAARASAADGLDRQRVPPRPRGKALR